MLSEQYFKDKELVRESEWIRVYRVGSEQLYYESKFVYDKLQVSASSIRFRWDGFSAEEKSDFVTAFQSKHPVTSEDEGILEFLMDVPDENVWNAIALPLTRMPPKKHERVLDFLLHRIQHRGGHRANYYQALATLKNPRAIRALKAAYEEERQSVSFDKPLGAFQDIFPYIDYLACCAALYELDGSDEFKRAIDDMRKHPDGNVRAQANLALARN
jgi:hypothetical protein